MIALLEMILGIHFEDETVPQFYIDCATQSIKNYMKVAGIDDSYNNVVVFLASYLYNHRLELNITEKAEGERKLVFSENDIPKEIVAMLPYPKVRFF